MAMVFGMDKDSKVEVGRSLAFMDIDKGKDKVRVGKIELANHKVDFDMVAIKVLKVIVASINHDVEFYFKALTPDSRLMVVVTQLGFMVVTHFVMEFKALHLFASRIFKCWLVSLALFIHKRLQI